MAQGLGARADGLEGQVGAVPAGAVALPKGEEDVGGNDKYEEGYDGGDDEGLRRE